LCYCLFLNNETHYLLGRAYLLFSCVVSFVLPVTQLSVLKPVEQLTLQPVVYTQPVNYGPLPEITIIEPEKHITMDDVLFYAYIVGALITLAVLFYRLYRLSLLMSKSKALYGNKYKLIQLNGDNTAFSFFNYLFIGTEVPRADTIIAHELVHIRQRHSADIIFVELLKVVSWFSPFIYLLQRSLRSIHEYIADEQTAAQERDALTYSSFLLNNAYGVQGSPIAHSFFNYNLLKKRIIMLNQKRSGRLARLKYLAAVPLCMGMLCASTLVFSKDYALIDLAPATPAQAEISIDEPITKTLKYFKIIDKVKDITAYSDNLSFMDKGVRKMFLAKNTAPADIAYIEKTMKLTVEVIDVDSKTKNPVVIFPNAKSDTAFATRPPAKFGNGYTLQENGYLIDKKVPYITVTITDKSGTEKTFNSTNATEAERKMLKDKYGFEFKKEEMMAFLKMASQSNKAFSNNPKLPPPPPPVPVKEGYLKLAQYISQAIEYPKDAIAKKLNASLIASFTVGSDGHISNVSVIGDADNSFIKAAEGIAKFPYTVKDKPGRKQMAINFNMLGDEVPAIAASVKNAPGFVGESGVTGMTAEQRKEYFRHLPPPPPPARPKKVGAVKGVKIAPPVVIADVKPVVTPTITIDAVTTVKAAPKVLVDVKPVVKTVPEITIDPLPAIAPAKPAKAAKPAKVKAIKLAPPAVVPNTPEIKIDEQPATPKVGQTKYKKAEKSFIIPPSPPLKNAQLQGPPPAYDKAYVALYSHMTRAIHYPNAAIENKTTGNVVLSYRVNASHKIIDIKVLKSIGKGCDEAMIIALKQYKGTVAKPEGEYFIAGAFILNKYSKAFESLGDLRFKPNFTGWVVIAANAMMSNDKTANIIQNSPTAAMVRPIIAFQANK
jgi:outer membrane biosynthesis protein TonB